MSKVSTRATIGLNGQPLPILPPDRDARVWARLVRVMFYTPGFMAILLIKTGEPAGFGISVELLMLSSASAIVAGLFIGTQSGAGGATASSRVGNWSGALVLELLSAVPFLCALPSLFHELATSNLLHAAAPSAIDTSLGASELLPLVAVLPFVLYQLSGFGTMSYVLPKAVDWLVNLSIVLLDHRELLLQSHDGLRERAARGGAARDHHGAHRDLRRAEAAQPASRVRRERAAGSPSRRRRTRRTRRTRNTNMITTTTRPRLRRRRRTNCFDRMNMMGMMTAFERSHHAHHVHPVKQFVYCAAVCPASRCLSSARQL